MADFPTAPIQHGTSMISVAEVLLGQSGTGPVSTAWPTANKAFFIPFRISQPVTARKMITGCGTAAGGNIDMGIFDVGGNRIVASGAVGRSASAEITGDITDTYLPRGLYYMAIACDGTSNMIAATPTGTSPVPLQKCRLYGMLEATSAYTLPDPVTFAAISVAFIPFVGIQLANY